MEAWWQTLPLYVNPIAFSFGMVSVSWYALFYIAGAGAALYFLWRRSATHAFFGVRENFWSLILSLLWGALIGARLGYVLFYGEATFFSEPWRILSPYDFQNHVWTGIRGMSFFGGLLGGGVALFLLTRKHKLSFWEGADFIVPAIPIALFFGRLGNFFNGELIGRPTETPWGMYFLADKTLRHPSQLYEALGEGILLFLLLSLIPKEKERAGFRCALFFILYGGIRFLLEFFREPDQGGILVGILTLNQAASLVLLLGGGLLLLKKPKKAAVVY